MQITDIEAAAQDQDRGHEFELRDPETGEGTGIRLRIVGPDSATQRRGRLQMVDDLAALADDDGRVSAANREKARLDALARCVVGWDIQEDGQPLPFNHANVLRLLKAAVWVQGQVDAFAGDRGAFRGLR